MVLRVFSPCVFPVSCGSSSVGGFCWSVERLTFGCSVALSSIKSSNNVTVDACSIIDSGVVKTICKADDDDDDDVDLDFEFVHSESEL